MYAIGHSKHSKQMRFILKISGFSLYIATNNTEIPVHNIHSELMRQNGNLTFEQIAEIRRSPLGTVKTQMRSALHKLRQKLTVSTDSL